MPCFNGKAMAIHNDFIERNKMTNFADLGLPENILHSLEHIGFETPTPIQEQAIPVIMQGRDVLGSAQTGTGKTGAFGIPMLAQITQSEDGIGLVLTPTRELAQQVLASLSKLISKTSKIKTALLIGGDPMPKQLTQLRNRPRIIVGTPGRINDHLKRRTLRLDNTKFLVLDETDRMLDMGFGIQLDEIAKYLPTERQTLMFSATMPNNIMALAKRFLNDPQRIAVGSTHTPIEKIHQELVKTTESTKYGELMNQLKTRDGSVLIFVKTKFGAERLAIKLAKENQSADAIHGDLRQSKRERVIANFREQKYRVLVATDIAARGLDIPHIKHVINYDLPQCPEDYIHRIGRTARAGAEGSAINLLTPQDGAKWKAIYKLINPSNRDKQMLGDENAPISAEPLNAIPRALRKNHRKGTNRPNRGDTVSADTVAADGTPAKKANPFKPYAPDKKAQNRDKFNKNARNFGFGASRGKSSQGSKSKGRANSSRSFGA